MENTADIVTNIPPQTAFQWREHGGAGNLRRVWRTDWAADDYQTMGESKFAQFEAFCRMFGLSLTQASDD